MGLCKAIASFCLHGSSFEFRDVARASGSGVYEFSLAAHGFCVYGQTILFETAGLKCSEFRCSDVADLSGLRCGAQARKP